jgi:beta-N-acetylhexosaminidase
MDLHHQADKTLETNLSLKRQIGQLFMVGFQEPTPSREIIDLIQRRYVGGVILFSRNIRDTQQVVQLTAELQAIAKDAGHPYPLLIATDQENGMVQRLGSALTALPGNMALGAIGDAEVVARVAELTGHELRQLGINMNLAPDVDVNNNPSNPVIGVRAFGEDAATVAHLTAAAVRGCHAAGTISCLKHFPGHGDTATDSHHGLPTLPFTLERLQALEFLPFISGIRAGATTIMVAHVALPQATPDHTGLPATVSQTVVQGLIRQELGYQGVVVSDCLEMDAVATTVGTVRAAVMALQAGIDLVLISHTYARQQESIEAVYEAVDSGELHPEAITAAVKRVLDLKQRYLSWATIPAATLELDTQQQLTTQLYRRSTTLVRDEGRVLPLDLDESLRILVVAAPPVSMTPAADLVYPHEVLVQSIQERHPNTQGILLDLQSAESYRQRLDALLTTADLVIVATINAHLDQRQVDLMKHILQSGKPTIGLATCDPYDLSVFPELGTYLATYEYTVPALVAAVEVLFGEAIAGGRLPVTIPGIALSSYDEK